MEDDRLVVDPGNTTWPRRPDSARRTSHIDIVARGETMMGAGFGLHGDSRDVMTGSDGSGRVVAEARLDAEVGPGRLLRELDTTPRVEVLDELIGRTVAGGFRAAVAEIAGDHHRDQTPLHTLLDDLPVASLISGYADLYVRAEETPTGSPGGQRRGPQSDICAGWQSGGTMMTAIERDGNIPVPVGPEAPSIELAGDPLSWHELPDLPVGAMRRRRLVDVTWGDPLEVRAMFRDTHVDSEGTETVLHEYDVEARVDPVTLEVIESAATPRVLPWIECPQAVASAGRLVGHRIGTLRDLVRKELKGVTTCTHLNDLLRSLDDVAPLSRMLGQARPQDAENAQGV